MDFWEYDRRYVDAVCQITEMQEEAGGECTGSCRECAYFDDTDMQLAPEYVEGWK